MQALIGTVSPWQARIDRARDLAVKQPWAAEILDFYVALAEGQRSIVELALDSPPKAAGLPAWTAERSLPLILEVAVNKGPEKLAHGVLARFQEADLEKLVESWLAGDATGPVDVFLARAATAPILEALPELAAATGRQAADERHCPGCGGAPQLSYFGVSGEVLVTAPRYLQCSRCSQSWVFPRLVCAACGETDSALLNVLADTDRLPGVRVDACDTCRTYLLTIDLPKDPAAVPLVDEMAALPLDLHARERGLVKITPNLMGF